MKYVDYSHRHDGELFTMLHPEIYNEIESIIESLDPFDHCAQKNRTFKEYIIKAFTSMGWVAESKINFNTSKEDYVDLRKGRWLSK